MYPYIHFTEEQKARARQTDLAELLRGQGEQLKRSGKEYEWRDGGAKVTVRGNLWYHQYEQVGGDAIDFPEPTKVARTIADMDESPAVAKRHLCEALGFRLQEGEEA